MCPFLPTLLGNSQAFLNKKEITINEISEVVSSVPRFSLVSLTGGEPLVREDFLQIVDTITKRNKLTLVTNGTLLSESIAQNIVKSGSKSFLSNGLFLLVFSIHGTEDTHDDICQVKGSFKQALRGLRYVQAAKKTQGKRYPLICLNCVVTQWNYHILSEIFELAENLQVDFCNFSLRGFSVLTNRLDNGLFDFDKAVSEGPCLSTFDDRPLDESILSEQLLYLEKMAQNSNVKLNFLPHGVSTKEIIKYYNCKDNKPARFSCFAPWRSLLITAYAGVSSCPFFFVGNIRENKISEIWNNKAQHRFRHELNKGAPLFCEKCCFSG